MKKITTYLFSDKVSDFVENFTTVVFGLFLLLVFVGLTLDLFNVSIF